MALVRCGGGSKPIKYLCLAIRSNSMTIAGYNDGNTNGITATLPATLSFATANTTSITINEAGSYLVQELRQAAPGSSISTIVTKSVGDTVQLSAALGANELAYLSVCKMD